MFEHERRNFNLEVLLITESFNDWSLWQPNLRLNLHISNFNDHSWNWFFSLGFVGIIRMRCSSLHCSWEFSSLWHWKPLRQSITFIWIFKGENFLSFTLMSHDGETCWYETNNEIHFKWLNMQREIYQFYINRKREHKHKWNPESSTNTKNRSNAWNPSSET